MSRDNELRRAVDARLSGLNVPPGRQMEILRRAQEEEQPVKRKISASLVLACALLLLTMAAGVAASTYGVLDFNREQKDNPEYTRHILQIDQSFTDDYFTMTINEAVFDSISLSMTMEIQPAQSAQPVYVYPRITAECGGVQLETDIEGCTGGDFWSGFWVPQNEEWANGGYYGVDCAVITDDEDHVVYDTQSEPVTWTVTFDVIKPEWPMQTAGEMLFDDEDHVYEDFLAYEQQFADAYEDHVILLGAYGDIIEFDAGLPIPDGTTEEEWLFTPLSERLVQSGAFSRVDELTASFETDGVAALTAELPLTVDLGEYEATLTELVASFARADYKFTVHKKNGSAAEDYLNDIGLWEFAVLSPAGGVQPVMTGGGCVSAESEDTNFSASVVLTAPTDELVFVPVLAPQPQTHPKDAVDAADVMRAGKPLDETQEAMAFTVKLK